MTELKLTRDVRFVDSQRDFEAMGEGTYDVPDDAVDDYLDRGVWEETENTERNSDSDADTDANSDSDDGSEDEAEDEAEDEDGNESESDEFDADAFLDRNVGPISDDIESGEVDTHLQAVLDAERDGSDRKGVKDSLETRASELTGNANEPGNGED